jgi:hypothetical protein
MGHERDDRVAVPARHEHGVELAAPRTGALLDRVVVIRRLVQDQRLDRQAAAAACRTSAALVVIRHLVQDQRPDRQAAAAACRTSAAPDECP